MAFDLSTPTAQLTFGVAQRAQEIQDNKDKLAAEARARASAQLAPFGNENSQTMSIFDSIYGPAAATQQARAKAMQEFVVGLPELLARMKAEKRSGGGGGGASKFVPQPYVSPEDYLNWLLGNNKGLVPTADKPGNFGLQNYIPAQPTSTVTPVIQRPTRGIGWDGKP
jgi:hypothetical protein